jgi:hypothetical protein
MPVAFLVKEIEIAIDKTGAQISVIPRVVSGIEFPDGIVSWVDFLHGFFVQPQRSQRESV